MARRPDLSPTQKNIVDRYYQHLDTITITKLQELVSELYLAQDNKAQALWKRVETALAKIQGHDAAIKRIIDTHDLQALAQLMTQLA